MKKQSIFFFILLMCCLKPAYSSRHENLNADDLIVTFYYADDSSCKLAIEVNSLLKVITPVEAEQDTTLAKRINKSTQGKSNQNTTGSTGNQGGSDSGDNQGNQNNQGNSTNNSGNTSGSGSSNQTSGQGNQNQQDNSTNNSGNTSGSGSSNQTSGQRNQNQQGNSTNNSGNTSGSGSSNQTSGQGNQNQQGNSINNSGNTSSSGSSNQTNGQTNPNQQGNSTNNSGNTTGSASSNQTGGQSTGNNSGKTGFNSSTEAYVKTIIWDGVISKSESLEAEENGSILAGLTPGGQYDLSKNWTIRFRMKLGQFYSNLYVFETDKAVLLNFTEDLNAILTKMEREGRVIESRANESASEEGRSLLNSECTLRLVIDNDNKTYRLLGKIEIEGISIMGKDEMDIKAKPVNAEIDEDADGTTGIEEEIEVTGTFIPEAPEKIPTEIKGTKDLFKDLPEEFKEFMKDLGGKQTNIIRWELKRKPTIVRKG
jgi:hypothetical protein